jgi:hypothetical protein
MAGERKGKAYEAIVKVAIDTLIERGKLTGEVFWNETPAGMTIEPDFTVGENKDAPRFVFLVTHGGSVKESNRKYWRNVGELWEAKALLATSPTVISVTFDSLIKHDIKLLETATFDGCLVLGDVSYGQPIIEWIEKSHPTLPTNTERMVDQVRQQVLDTKGQGALSLSFSRLVEQLAELLAVRQSALDDLWLEVRRPAVRQVPEARTTSVRRGLAKALLLGVMPTKAAHAPKDLPAWISALGFMTPGISGPRDPDLAWLASGKLSAVSLPALAAHSSEGFRSQLLKVRSVALIAEYAQFVMNNLASLQTARGMLDAIQQLHRAPETGLSVPTGVDPPRAIWLLDIVGAILKAKSGKAQAFGYATFAKHAKAERETVGNMSIGSWCSCFMNQYFNRRPDFVPPKAAIDYCAEVLSDSLSEVTTNDISRLGSEIRDRYLAKEFEATLLSHRGFDPIGYLVGKALDAVQPSEERIAGGFSERAGISAGSGTTGILRVCHTLVKWQSVTDEGRVHKKKELCGRALALRYSWDAKRSAFVHRTGICKLVLILDGTWRQEDLVALSSAGWDEILYPDEMDKLVKAIV